MASESEQLLALGVRMKHEDQIAAWIKEDGERSEALALASSLYLDDWCLAAGFVRNLVWDKIHRIDSSTPLNDIDLIYFNADDCSEKTDRAYEDYLKSVSDYPWSVKNQARMHVRNRDSPYSSTADAMSYWVEVETAIGAKLSTDFDIELVAPFGFSSLFSSTISINQKRRKPEDFFERVHKKKWLEKWPNLRINV